MREDTERTRRRDGADPAGRAAAVVRLDGVQVLRGLAALSVAFLHIEQAAGALVGRVGQSPWPWLRALPWEAGVDVFFVISGFVMVHASRGLFGRARSVRPFLARRIARIVPLYWLVTTLTLLAGAGLPGLLNDPFGGGPRFVLASYAFIPFARADGSLEPVFRLGWTLNAEMFFYLVFALALPLPRRAAAGAVIATMIGLVSIGLIVRPASPQAAFWTDPIVAEFGFGVALGALRAEGVRLPAWARAGLILAALAGLALAGPDALRWRPLAYGLPAAALLAAAGLSRAPSQARGAAPWLAPWLALGDASYALYLLHLFPMRALREVWSRSGWIGEAGVATFIPAALAAACLVAILAHRLIERPLVRWLRTLLHA